MSRRFPELAALAFTAFLIAAGPATEEPPGPWTGDPHAPLPASIAGGGVIHTDALRALIASGTPLLLDVAARAERPEGLAPGNAWLPPAHRDIAGSVWLPGFGRGVLAAGEADGFQARVAALANGDHDRTIVVYCHERCWLSWNAARRLIDAGWHHVLWYPEGVEGWEGAGQALAATR